MFWTRFPQISLTVQDELSLNIYLPSPPKNTFDMKRILSIVLMSLLLASPVVVAEDVTPHDAAAQWMSLAHDRFGSQSYDVALADYNAVVKMLEQAGCQSDSLYYTAWMMVGKTQFRLHNLQSAVEAAKKAQEVYEAYRDLSDSEYGNILDNIGFYYSALGKYAEAEPYEDRALEVYRNDSAANLGDLKAVLIHVAEVKSHLGKLAEAIVMQKEALALLEENGGYRSQEYIDELEYLQTYYEKNGDSASAKSTGEEVKKLKDELENGYVPLMRTFDSAEKCREYVLDAYYACKYYTHHYLTADRMNECAQYIINWSVSTDLVTIRFGDAENKWMTQDNMPFFVAFFAGNVMDALERGEDDPEAQYINGVIVMLNYYSANKEILNEEIPEFEEYLKLYAKGQKHLIDRLKKNYKKMEKLESKGQKQMVEGTK